MIELFHQAQLIVQALNQAAVDYALCGGIAVGVYGHIRATEDIDIVIRSDDDLAAIDAVLKPLGWDNLSESIEFKNGFILHRRVKASGADVVQLDILVAPAHVDVLSDRVLSDLQGIACWIISKPSLRIMKEGTGRQKDQDDLLHLQDDGDL